MTTKLLLLAIFVFCMILMSLNHSKKKKKVIFFGDSLNDLDTKPGGYISWIINHLKNEGLEEKYNLVASVKPAQKIYDLYIRLEENVLIKDAHFAVLYLGVYDVWDKYLKGTGTDIETFEKLLETIIIKLQAANIKILLCTPVPQIKSEFPADLLDEVNDYANVIRDLAATYNLRLADLSETFNQPRLLGENETYIEANPNRFVANEIWRILGDMR